MILALLLSLAHASTDVHAIKDKILKVALADPDAFDSLRVRDEGVAYVCADEYSDQLTKLCKEIRK